MTADNPMARQVAGGHYKSLAIQPAEFWIRNQLPAVEGAVVKYLTRHGSKGGRRDLEKSIHFIEMMIWWYFKAPPSERVMPRSWRGGGHQVITPKAYAETNGLGEVEAAAIYFVCTFTRQAHLEMAASMIRNLCDAVYPPTDKSLESLTPGDVMYLAKRQLENYLGVLRLAEGPDEQIARVERIVQQIDVEWRS